MVLQFTAGTLGAAGMTAPRSPLVSVASTGSLFWSNCRDSRIGQNSVRDRGKVGWKFDIEQTFGRPVLCQFIRGLATLRPAS